jgi:hypothetical protein
VPQKTSGAVLAGAPATLLALAQVSARELCADRCADSSLRLLQVRLQI